MKTTNPKVLGISGSPRKKGGTAKLVNEILDATGIESEYISLAGKKITPCKFCLACAKDNLCKVKDDMYDMREKLVQADALVIGGCNMWSNLNGLTQNFLERFFQFHHQGKNPMKGKVGVAVGIGGGSGEAPARVINRYFQIFGIRSLDTITSQGAFACYSCGLGNTCDVSLVQDYVDEDGQIDMSFKPDLDKQPQVKEAARKLGQKIKDVLR